MLARAVRALRPVPARRHAEPQHVFILRNCSRGLVHQIPRAIETMDREVLMNFRIICLITHVIPLESRKASIAQ